MVPNNNHIKHYPGNFEVRKPTVIDTNAKNKTRSPRAIDKSVTLVTMMKLHVPVEALYVTSLKQLAKLPHDDH